MLRWITAWRKSMFAQMVLLTTIFLGWGVYAFVVRPMSDLPADAQVQPPLQMTEAQLRSTLHNFMIDARDTPEQVSDIADDPLVQRVVAANPEFRYYVRAEDRVFGNGEPVFFEELGLDRFAEAQRRLPKPVICSQMTEVIAGEDADAYASFYMCDKMTYLEYHGLKNAVSFEAPAAPGIGEKFVRAFSGNFLLAAVGVFAIFALIFVLHIISIGRIARLARSIDPQHLDAKLPEKGVATEVLPLVRAVNELIAEVEAVQRRATFFLSAAAHEMRTPLTVLRTRLELMEDGDQKDKLVGDVRRLTSLVNQLLTLMSISNRRDVTGFTDLVVAARKVASDLAPIAEAAGVSISFESEVSELEVIGEKALIRSAIGNLVENCISFSPAGGKVVLAVGADGIVTVRDHGPGLGDADPDSLFEPFSRQISNRRGYGLGLAIVNAIVRLHGGRATAANAPGGGAVFTVSFCS